MRKPTVIECAHCMNLDELRQEIDRIDAGLVELLKQRMGCVHAVGEIKKDTNSHIFVPESQSTDRWLSWSKAHDWNSCIR